MKAWAIAFGIILVAGGLGLAGLFWFGAQIKGADTTLGDDEKMEVYKWELAGFAVGLVGIGLIVWASN